MKIQKLWLLSWKYLLLRKNRWFLTGCELILPILAIFALCYGYQKIPHKEHQNNATVSQVYNAANLYNATNLDTLYFTPATMFTNQTMELVFHKINGKGYTRIKTLKSVENETEMRKLLSSTNLTYPSVHESLGVAFLNLPRNEAVPDKLTYKILVVNWQAETNKLYGEISPDPPTASTKSYLDTGLAGLQYALDSSYINLTNISSNSQYEEGLLQAFPYPAYVSGVGATVRSLAISFVAFFVVASSMFLSIPLMTAVISEKESGIKELMKLVGLEEWLMWTSWFLNSLVISASVFTIVTWILQHKFAGFDSAALQYVDPMILWLFIMLYLMASVSFCFTFCAVFHKTTLATIVYAMAVILICFGTFYTRTYRLNVLTCFFPPGALIQGFKQIQRYEFLGIQFTWSSVFWIEKTSTDVSLGFVFLMLFIDMCLYLLITYYVSAINPGPFGSKRPLLFFLECFFARYSSSIARERLLDREDEFSCDKFIETPPAGLETSIEIMDLHKNFGDVYAVRGVNLTAHKGEITALLGPNGAGKSTTIAILTGLTEPNSGSIIYKDEIDVLKRMDEFRKDLGLCPQEDRLFPYLSVMNHLLFFGMLKGATKEEAEEEAKEYLNLMELYDKRNSLISSLSGGMKRKLCLMISLMGKAKILILDEPTSGLDVQSRRKIWDLLLELRRNRTIILTTHHMEEADVLGDRIAIMRDGAIECYGTAMFLKHSYGAGYQLTISKTDDDSKLKMLTNLIAGQVPNAKLIQQSATEVVYALPVVETAEYPSLFQKLETEKYNLGVENIGITCTTMEDVFLEAGGSQLYKSAERSSNNSQTASRNFSPPIMDKKIGLSLIFQQLQALLLKKFLYTSRDLTTLFLRVVVPSCLGILLFLCTLDMNPDSPVKLLLSTYPNSIIMMQNKTSTGPDITDSFSNYVTQYNEEIKFSKGTYVVEGLLDYGRRNLLSFRDELLLGAEFNATKKLVLFNNNAIHSFGMAISAYSNSFIQFMSESDRWSITTFIDPVVENSSIPETNFVGQLVPWFIGLAWFSMDLCDYFILLPKVERIDGFKHIQYISKVSPFVYWLSNIIFDAIFFMLIILLRIMVFKPFDRFGFLDFSSTQMAVLLMVFAIFVPGALLYSYVVSCISKSKDSSYLIMFFINIGCFIGILIVFFVEMLTRTVPTEGTIVWVLLSHVAKFAALFVPPLNLGLTFVKILCIWTLRHNGTELAFLEFASEKNPYGILKEIIFLFVDIILYTGVLIVMETADIRKLITDISGRIFNSRDTNGTGAHANVELGQSWSEESILLVENLKKKFFKFTRSFTAVENVTFAVKPTECFGLLGVNGAGKSTTFKMLSGELVPSGGDSSILNYKLSTHKNEYLSRAGYCAQTNCFIEELTGKEMLTLIARLRGTYPKQINELVRKWLSVLDLEIYANQRCGTYSGGNKRKLCTIMSLIGDPNVVFLDEPTSGVDPVSRHKLYTVMDQSRASGQAVVLTSHSMEECERLCDRLTIMANGQIQCMGTVQQLKQQHAQGFSIQIKIRDMSDSEERLNSVKEGLLELFKPQYCVLKDEHKGLLHYQITDVHVPWSESFNRMEYLKDTHVIVENYMISDTSLEQVFLLFAKQSLTV